MARWSSHNLPIYTQTAGHHHKAFLELKLGINCWNLIDLPIIIIKQKNRKAGTWPTVVKKVFWKTCTTWVDFHFQLQETVSRVCGPYLGYRQMAGRCGEASRCRTPDRWWQTWGWQRTREGQSGAAGSWPSWWTSALSVGLEVFTKKKTSCLGTHSVCPV